MANTSNIIRSMEKKRDELHHSLIEGENTSNYEALALSIELDEIMNLYYGANVKNAEITCMICGEKMHKKAG